MRACSLRQPGHVKGSPAWLDLDREEPDAVYRQEVYQPLLDETNSRIAALSFEARLRRGYPERVTCGGHPERMDIYRASVQQAPVVVLIPGGT